MAITESFLVIAGKPEVGAAYSKNPRSERRRGPCARKAGTDALLELVGVSSSEGDVTLSME